MATCEVQLALAPDADRCFTAFQVSSLRRAVGAGEAKTLGVGMAMRRAMTRIETATVWVSVAAMFALGGYFVLGRLVTSPSERAFARKFETLRIGTPESEVLALLGPPTERSDVFRLGQPHGYEKEYAAAASSGSRYYLLWRRELDLVYAVGFDQEQRVRYSAVGGT